MYFLIFLIIVIVVYIVSFKDSFTKENFDKVAPLIIIVIIFMVGTIILKCIL